MTGSASGNPKRGQWWRVHQPARRRRFDHCAADGRARSDLLGSDDRLAQLQKVLDGPVDLGYALCEQDTGSPARRRLRSQFDDFRRGVEREAQARMTRRTAFRGASSEPTR